MLKRKLSGDVGNECRAHDRISVSGVAIAMDSIVIALVSRIQLCVTLYSTKDNYNARGEGAREYFLTSVMLPLHIPQRFLRVTYDRTFYDVPSQMAALWQPHKL